jgi:hypothetical protein
VPHQRLLLGLLGLRRGRDALAAGLGSSRRRITSASAALRQACAPSDAGWCCISAAISAAGISSPSSLTTGAWKGAGLWW